MKAALVALLAALSLGGCASTDASGDSGGGGGGDSCIILANGGRKLCGSDAAAWCRSTDSIREGSSDPDIQQAQSDCAALESQYPQ